MSNEITPENSIVPIFRDSLSTAEVDARKTEQDLFEQNQVEKEAKLASAITKLKALGLTETEAKIIIGIE